MVYRSSYVNVNVLPNPRIANLGGGVRLPAVVALGPTTVSVVDEAVQRGTGSVDYLSVYATSGVTISQIANSPGVVSGKLNAVLVSQSGALYNTASGSFGSGDGSMTWNLTPSVDVPSTGSVYYVTYSYDAPASQYDPTVMVDKKYITAKYGAENTANGMLSIGGSIALENNSPGVLLVQATGSSYNVAAYQAAIDKLQKKSNIEQLVILFPSGSVTRAQQETLLTYAYTHVKLMNQNGRERGLMLGTPSTGSATDGFDAIGDSSTAASYVYRASVYKDKNVAYVVPSTITRLDASGNEMVLDGNYGALGVAAVQAAQSKRSTPIHGFQVVGLTLPDEKWHDTEMDQLGSGGCLVLMSEGGAVTIRDAITTDMTSADTQEVSVVAQERLVKRTLRDGLKNKFTGKGIVITPSTNYDVQSYAQTLLTGLVSNGELYGYGVAFNPVTGETPIVAAIDSTEPRKVNLTCSVKYLYPLKFMDVTVSVFI